MSSMLDAGQRLRNVVEISYGCIGRSLRHWPARAPARLADQYLGR
jgi:hypothetical protein